MGKYCEKISGSIVFVLSLITIAQMSIVKHSVSCSEFEFQFQFQQITFKYLFCSNLIDRIEIQKLHPLEQICLSIWNCFSTVFCPTVRSPRWLRNSVESCLTNQPTALWPAANMISILLRERAMAFIELLHIIIRFRADENGWPNARHVSTHVVRGSASSIFSKSHFE